MEQGTAEYIGGLRMDQAVERARLSRQRRFHAQPADEPRVRVGGRQYRISSERGGAEAAWMERPVTYPGHRRLRVGGAAQRGSAEKLNPERGWIATANNNIHPPGFKDPLFYNGRAPYWRHERITQMLEGGQKAGKKFTVEDMRVMLRDSFKAEAEQLKPWFHGWSSTTPEIERARVVDCIVGQHHAEGQRSRPLST